MAPKFLALDFIHGIVVLLIFARPPHHSAPTSSPLLLSHC